MDAALPRPPHGVSVSSALPAQETRLAARGGAYRRTTRPRTARQRPRHTRPLPPRQARPRAHRSRHGCGPAPPPARRERFERPSGARNAARRTHPRAPPGHAPAPAVGRFGGASRPRSLNRRGGRWPRPPLVSLPTFGSLCHLRRQVPTGHTLPSGALRMHSYRPASPGGRGVCARGANIPYAASRPGALRRRARGKRRNPVGKDRQRRAFPTQRYALNCA